MRFQPGLFVRGEPGLRLIRYPADCFERSASQVNPELGIRDAILLGDLELGEEYPDPD